MYVPAAHAFSSCTTRTARTAPHRTAWHYTEPASLPAQQITTSAGDAAPITLLEARPHHRSHGLGARGTVGVWRRSRGGLAPGVWKPGRGSGRIMRAMQHVKAVMVVLVLVLVVEAAVRERSSAVP